MAEPPFCVSSVWERTVFTRGGQHALPAAPHAPGKQGKTRGAAQTATPARMTPRVTFCPFWLVMTALTVISRNVSVHLRHSAADGEHIPNEHGPEFVIPRRSRQCSPGQIYARQRE